VNGYSIRLRSGALPAPAAIAFSNLWVGYDFVIARAIAKLLNIRYGG
jgi:hypothetical protein